MTCPADQAILSRSFVLLPPRRSASPHISISNGQPLPAYSGDRSYSDLSNWIDEQSTLYARGQLLESNEEKEVVMSGFGRPNPEGKVLEVDEGGLDVLVRNGPVMVEYYAPWCAQWVYLIWWDAGVR